MNLDHLHKTLVASQYAEQVLEKHKSLLEQDYQRDQFFSSLSKTDLKEIITSEVAHITDEMQWMSAIRILRARLMFRWIWQDSNQLTNVIQLTQELSDFADLAVSAAKEFAYRPLVAKYGEPIGYGGKVQDLIVIAMGKHGAQELNLSSDIDLPDLPAGNYSGEVVYGGDENHTSTRQVIPINVARGVVVISVPEVALGDSVVIVLPISFSPPLT